MKYCLIGDLHFGEKGNSEKHNKQVLGVLQFAIDESKKRGVTTCFQFGDYFDNRTKIEVSTLGYGIDGAKLLADNFDVVMTIVSNHDIYHRDRLDITSMRALEPYMDVISEPTMISDTVAAIPWVVDGKSWDEAIQFTIDNKAKFLFGHLELNGFLVNDMYEMEHGYSPTELKHLDHVYTGHYHTPQVKKNITYLGTPIPISMNEANGVHGIYFFDDETGELEFVQYKKVQVVSVSYEDLEDAIKDADPENTYIRVEFPDDLEDETVITDIQKQLDSLGFRERKIKYSDQKVKKIMEADVDSVEEVENIDAVVVQFIKGSSSVNGIDSEILYELYQKASTKSDGE